MKRLLNTIEKEKKKKSVPFENVGQLEAQNNYWIEIYEDNRQRVLEDLLLFNLDDRLKEYILEPWTSTRVGIFNNAMIINLPVPNSRNKHESDYLTIIVFKNILLTILNEGNQLFSELRYETDNNLLNLELTVYHVVYFMTVEVFQLNMRNLAEGRKRINQLTNRLDNRSETVNQYEITSCKAEISKLSNMVEDQYNMMGFMPTLNWTHQSQTIRNEFQDLLQSFGHVQRSFARLEEKMESIQNQYQLLLQERGNKKLNTLTVIQSVFVPLTLLTGIYGMNFEFMPELAYKNGYYMVWLLMTLITGFQLFWFKRKGWFD
ncbi:MAG: hypothetical protein MI866_06000 [Bacteroidales bacterium]|nr:hypothetical protein [Bacteroidales bacterium]